MRTRYVPETSRRILCVFPRYAPSFTRECARGAGEASFYAPTAPSSAVRAS